MDDELDRGVQEELSAHLISCHECAAAVSAQMELKKAVRIAGRTHSAPPKLHAAVYRTIHSQQNLYPWSKWILAAFGLLALSPILFLSFSRLQRDPIMAALVDQHTTMLASEHAVDVISDSRNIVRPWFQSKLPFSFNIPDVSASPFTLVGGKAVYFGQNPSAQLVYKVGTYKVSVFIIQVRRGGGRSGSSRDLSFTVDSWSQGGLQCYLVTDAPHKEVDRLVSMFREANPP